MNKINRPLSISLISILMSLSGIPIAISFSSREFLNKLYPNIEFPDLYIYWSFFIGISSIFIAFFLWKMKKLAAYAFVLINIIGFGVSYYIWGKISTNDLSTIFIWLFLFKHINKMT